MDEGVAAVRVQFPEWAETIDALASKDESFLEICRDFAEAQVELAKWEVSPGSDRQERCAEYRELIAGLGKEIQDALNNVGTVPFRHIPN